jgi:serine/threonine protein kinase
MQNHGNWIAITESSFSWERDALNFLRERFPSTEPYLAWSNFEFIASDGSINEVDLLVFTPKGFFIIEIKSRPGRISGDAGTWKWEAESTFAVDNPLLLVNHKAKKLSSLLQQTKTFRKDGRVPFLEALVFCSAEQIQSDLTGTAAYRICFRDNSDGSGKRPGIVDTILNRRCPGVDPVARGTLDRPTARLIAKAMGEAGIRPSQKSRRVSDYVLEQLIDEGPFFQDWRAKHSKIESMVRRIRIYNIASGATAEQRKTLERAARREAQILDELRHPGVLRFEGLTQHELGPALIFEHDASLIRLDHYLKINHDRLTVDDRLHLVRQIAEVLSFAHEKRIFHRGLSPRSILVQPLPGGRTRIRVFNWQLGARGDSDSQNVSRSVVTATSHIDHLIEDSSLVYMAPEAVEDGAAIGEHLDIFSIGAIAYTVFSGQVPASDRMELAEKLRHSSGLQISDVLNGAGEWLQNLIASATHPLVEGNRTSNLQEFLDNLDLVEEELTTPDDSSIDNPAEAQRGTMLPGGFEVLKRLGEGSCATALLVKRQHEQFVLKIANTHEDNARILEEADVIANLQHSHIVRFRERVRIGERDGMLLVPVLVTLQDQPQVETLAKRLRRDGKLHIDLLQRFGDDLLGVLEFLEEQGINHRDIKPDNIAIGYVGSGKKLHLTLFDFSLSRVPTDQIRAGTRNYLEPFLEERKPPRWDLHAERYAAAVTLYELATGPGSYPVWGDGKSSPTVQDCDATLHPDLLDASVREPLTTFFERAFRRNPKERFDNAEQMLTLWRECFKDVQLPAGEQPFEDEEALAKRLAFANETTHTAELGLSASATDAMDHSNVLTVADLIKETPRSLQRWRGMSNQTRREVQAAARILRKRLLAKDDEGVVAVPQSQSDTTSDGRGAFSIDALARQILKPGAKDGDDGQRVLNLLLGMSEDSFFWPSQVDIAQSSGLSRERIAEIVTKTQNRWKKDSAITQLRSTVEELLHSAGGVLSIRELSAMLLVARGSVLEEPVRSRISLAVCRAAVEVERCMSHPRFHVRRDTHRVLIALQHPFAAYASRLGDMADEIAAEDPLMTPARAIEALRSVSVPEDSPTLTESRLLRLAAAASTRAAVSSRQELYLRGLHPVRALRLSQGAIYGVTSLTVEQIRNRVNGRYPEAEPLPGRPALDALLAEAGLQFQWDPSAGNDGAYVSTWKNTLSVTSRSESIRRKPTSEVTPLDGELSEELADAKQFDERMRRGLRDGFFQVLLVTPRYYQMADALISEKFNVCRVDFEGLFIEKLRHVAEQLKVDWQLILQTDAKPDSGDWKKLMLLVNRVMPEIELQLQSYEQTVFLVYPGLLARYRQLGFLERLRDGIGRKGGMKGLWLLMPGDHHVVMDGHAVPIISPGQKVQVPISWLRNDHSAVNDAKLNSHN